jgi:hypothetical protein
MLQIEDNAKYTQLGLSICDTYLKAVLNFWYSNLPHEGVE